MVGYGSFLACSVLLSCCSTGLRGGVTNPQVHKSALPSSYTRHMDKQRIVWLRCVYSLGMYTSSLVLCRRRFALQFFQREIYYRERLRAYVCCRAFLDREYLIKRLLSDYSVKSNRSFAQHLQRLPRNKTGARVVKAGEVCLEIVEQLAVEHGAGHRSEPILQVLAPVDAGVGCAMRL